MTVESRPETGPNTAKTSDIVAIYQILLGRNPENATAIETYSGASVEDVFGRILSSGELSQLAADAMASGAVPHSSRLTAPDFTHSAEWLGNAIGTTTLGASASWWLLVDSALNVLWRSGYGQALPAALADYAAIAAICGAEDRLAFARMQSGMEFDSAWFQRAHRRAVAELSPGEASDPAKYFLRTGCQEGKQLLAAFSENLPRIYAGVPEDERNKLSGYVSAVIEAAGRGETGHWLFAMDFCRDMRTRRPLRSARTTIGGPVSYLQFLLDGDKEGWAPHPLFSNYAYQRLNRLPDDRAGFGDYVTRGIFEGCRTSALFDPDYYLARNPSGRLALLRGTHHDALHHFLTVGIFEGLGFSPDFDPVYYAEIYPDVVESVRTGVVPSASWHFIHLGLVDGRRPNEFFDPAYYRQRHPHVVAEMALLGIASELEHFLLLGRARGLKAEPPLAERLPSLENGKIVFRRRALRSFDRQWRTPLDFEPFKGKARLLSIIVPVCNEVPFTALFLESAFFAAARLFQKTGNGVEVIVVDNGSSDETAALIARTAGLVVLQYAEPIGYPRAIAAGMTAAEGAIVVVANNDVAFLPDAFELVTTTLAADASIGILGALVMLPDETLQEAGSFVDRNGGIVNVGRFENPWDAYFRVPIESDYCAGCFFAFRREDVVAIGGIDEAFSPGYYEEVDLAFRMRELLGKRAVVLPDLQVTHFEHASFGKGRPPSTALAAIQRNQTMFTSKHGQALLERPTPSALSPGGVASAIAIGRRRLLVITETLPHMGGGIEGTRSVRLLRALEAAGLAFEILVLRPAANVDAYEDSRVTIRRGWMPGEDPQAILAQAGRRFSHILVLGVTQLARFATTLESIRQVSGIQIFCDTMGLSAVHIMRDGASAEAVRDAVSLELRTPALVSPWIAVDEYERSLIEDAGFGIAVALSTLPDTEEPGPHWPERAGLLLVGGASNCLTGANWFAGYVRPHISSASDTAPLLLSGGWQTRLAYHERDEAPDRTVEVIDTPDVGTFRALHHRCRVAIAPPPLASTAAVLQAMAFDVPVVLSAGLAKRLAASGHDIAGLAVADDGKASAYAMWIDRLIEDEASWANVRAAQRALLARARATSTFADDLGRLLTCLTAGNRDRF